MSTFETENIIGCFSVILSSNDTTRHTALVSSFRAIPNISVFL